MDMEHYHRVCKKCKKIDCECGMTQPNSGELKPCPFCGCDDIRINEDKTFVFCSQCGAIGPQFGVNKYQLIREWNRRNSDEQR